MRVEDPAVFEATHRLLLDLMADGSLDGLLDGSSDDSGADGLPLQPLYLVSFAQREVWADYAGGSGDRLYVDVFEHWLEEAE